MCKLTVASALLSWLVIADLSSGHAETWPTFRHDSARSGFTSVSFDASRLEEAWSWKSHLPPTPAWDGPARWDAYARISDLPAMRQYDAAFHTVSDGEFVYFGSSSQDTVTALRLSDGSEVWRFFANGPIRLAPTLNDGHIYFGCDDGAAYCLDAASGELVWRFNPSAQLGLDRRLVINNDRLISFFPVRTGVLIRDERAYFGAALLPWRDALLCSVDATTGTLDKPATYIAPCKDATLEGAMLVANDRLIVPQGRVAPLLFHRRNGKRLGNLPGGGGVTVVLTDRGETVRAEGGAAARPGQVGIYKDDEKIASFPRGRAMVIRPETIYVIDNSQLFAARRADNELLWRTSIDSPLELIMANNTLFVGGRDKVTAVDASNGAAVWQSEVTGRAFGLAIANDCLIVSTDTGSVHVFAPTSLDQWKTVIDEAPTRQAAPIEREPDPRPIHHWVFQHNGMANDPGASADGAELTSIAIRDLAGNANATLKTSAQTVHLHEGAPIEAIAVDESYFALPDDAAANLPTKTITAECWVRVDKTLQWGGIVGCIQDDGDVEHGWLLGYRDDRFSFALAAGASGLTYLTASRPFKEGEWHHVAGTFDGATMRLYVDGALAGQSNEETGPISYPEDRSWTIAAYHDDNEHFPMSGAVHEVRVYNMAFAESEVRARWAVRKDEFPLKAEQNDKALVSNDSFLSWGPVARFIRPGAVEVSYGTFEATETVVSIAAGKRVTTETNPMPTTEHKIVVDEIPFHRQVSFAIAETANPSSPTTESYVLDSHFNWTRIPREPVSSWAAKACHEAPNPRGIAVVVGAAAADRAVEIARSSGLSVVLLVDDEEAALKLRQQTVNADDVRYGVGCSVLCASIDSLPASFASIVVALEDTSAARRLLRPNGTLWVGDEPTWRRPELEGAGAWSHMYGHTNNSAFCGEQLGGAKTREELVTQWIGRPGPRYQTDRQNRKPTPLAVGGRFYLQGLQRLLALDAYSGSILWTMETPTVMRWNVPHDSSNWCGDEDEIYVAARNQAWAIDGASGVINRRIALPNEAGKQARTSTQARSWGFIALHDDLLLGTDVLRSAIFTDWWGNENWYDSTNGADTHVVCGDQLFALDKSTGAIRWTHDAVVLHPTITILGKRIIFVENRSDASNDASERRIPLNSSQTLFMVGLDIATGKQLWEMPVQQPSGHAAAMYLAGGTTDAGREHLISVTSESETSQFVVQEFDPDTGERGWTAQVAWEANHHGKHISRPAIQGDLIYLRPEVLSLATGEQIVRGFPSGHGCASYALCTQGLIGRLGSTTWWDPRTQTVSRFPRLRTDCWISAIPAQGMLLSAEGGGGCSCGTWIETSIAFLPQSVDETLPGK